MSAEPYFQTTSNGYPYPYLIDSPADGIVEEHGHLPLNSASTPDEAAAEFARLYEPGDEARPHFYCDGERAWLKPVVYGESEPRPPTASDWEDDEDIGFHKADPSDPGAQEWWVVYAMPQCERYDEAGDFYCALVEGHSGPCKEQA